MRARIRGQHYGVLTKYLLQRSADQKFLADDAGLTTNEILRRAYDVKNGQTTVPQDAYSVFRRVPGVDVDLIWALFLRTPDPRQVPWLLKSLEHGIKKGTFKDDPDVRAMLALAAAHVVTQS